MSTTPHTRIARWRALLGTVLLAVTLTSSLAGTAEARPVRPDRIDLPVGFQPEGIAIRHGVAFVGSRVSGDIYAANLRTGAGRIISVGPSTGSLGLKVDRRDRLFVAGSTAGTGRVVSVRTGAILASYTFTTKPSFVNDVVLTGGYAWFTDSAQAQLYRVTRPKNPATATVKTLPLGGQWKQVAGATNANGIASTPDRRGLLVIQSNTGFLFRVDPRSGVARRVDLGGVLLTNGDGLLLEGRTLYVVQNRFNQIAVVALNAAGTRGAVRRTITSAQFSVPSTVAAYRGNLYLPNARFGEPSPGTIDYWITRVPRR